MKKKFVIQTAMSFEAKAFSKVYKLEKVDIFGDLPIRAFKYTDESKEVYVVSNGTDKRFNINRMGAIPAALTTIESINRINPDFIICTGGVGSLSHKAKLWNVYVNIPIISYNDRIIPEPGYEYGKGKFETYDISKIAQKFNIEAINFSSANSVILNQMQKESLLSSEYDTTDMESVAVAEVCHMYCVKMFCVKGVTNIVINPENPAKQSGEIEGNVMELVAEKIHLIIEDLCTV